MLQPHPAWPLVDLAVARRALERGEGCAQEARHRVLRELPAELVRPDTKQDDVARPDALGKRAIPEADGDQKAREKQVEQSN
jgi:hypothetical protein